MALILNIDTATEEAGVCLARDGQPLGILMNNSQQDHASWLQPAVNELLSGAGVGVKELDAVAVTLGPGSYTGLRVGLASAKGLCYALQIPLITESTLKVMALAMMAEAEKYQDEGRPLLLCPMIDARRMEVFTAVFNNKAEVVEPEAALILEKNSFANLLQDNNILFAGSGAPKWKPVCDSPYARYAENALKISTHLAFVAEAKFQNKQFSDLAYTEPAYLKEFYTYIKK